MPPVLSLHVPNYKQIHSRESGCPAFSYAPSFFGIVLLCLEGMILSQKIVDTTYYNS